MTHTSIRCHIAHNFIDVTYTNVATHHNNEHHPCNLRFMHRYLEKEGEREGGSKEMEEGRRNTYVRITMA